MRKTSLQVFLSVMMVAFFSCKPEKEERPNIILLLVDDLGWKDLECTGSQYYLTPHINNLAHEGMIFSRGYSASPVCSPSRGAIFSGKYPARTGLTGVFGINSTEAEPVWHPYSKSEVEGANSQHLEAMNLHVLPLAEYTFGEALKVAGYATGYLGKWHCGWNTNFNPGKQGFSYVEGFRTVPSFTKGHFGDSYIKKVKGLDLLKPEDDMTDVLTGKALQFIKSKSNEPFLLVLSYYAVHAPLQAKKEVIEKYKNRKPSDQDSPVYAAMVESVDNSVGKINGLLKKLNLDQNTLIVFTSDNGGFTRFTSNYPLLGGKSMAYEASMRVPFIVKWPAKINAGTKSDTRVIGTDIYPTVLDAAGISLNKGQELDGRSLLGEFSGKKMNERELYFYYPHYTGSTSPFLVLLDGDWKLIRYYNNDDSSGGYQLFNMKKDPYELSNKADEHPEIVQNLSRKMDAWLKETNAKLPTPNSSYNPEEPATRTGIEAYKIALKYRRQAGEKLNDRPLK